MPAIKKKWIKASQDGGTAPDEENEDVVGDEDKEHGGGEPAAAAVTSKAKKRPIQSSSSHSNMLKGLDGEVLSQKRKRFTPPAELKLSEWLDNNLEKHTEKTLHLPHLYRYYTELCQADGSEILDVPQFNRMVKEKFGKTFGIKETSVYKTLIKERNINKDKKKTGTGIKLKEIIHEAINHFGNPWNGVRFFSLKQYIGYKYPALQIDQRPKLLKRALEMGTQYGQIDLVKGIGMAGFYKLPGGEPPPKTKPKSKKEDTDEKSADNTGETKGSEDEKEEKEAAENGEKKEDTDDTKKKKKQKSKKVEKISFSKLHHGNPEKMEDIFPLAITYQSAPKAASVPKIRRYIQEKYGEIVPDNRWRRAIESGAEKGQWEHVSGSGITGSLHLLMDDFDPESDLIEDMICAGIIACHEPKSASASQIKKYVSQYHADFKVDEKPDRFKKALLRAVSKNMLVQLSGLGANGSFQLSSPFTPSPAVLAGEDDDSEVYDSEVYDSDDEPDYVPRGTKSRGIPKKKVEVSNKSVKNKAQKKSTSPISKGRAKSAVNSHTESDDDSEEDKAPKRKQKKTPSKGREKQNNKIVTHKPARSPTPSDDDDENDEQPEYTPRKSQSRGGQNQNEAKVTQSKKIAATPSKTTTKKSVKKPDLLDEDSPICKETPKKSIRKEPVNEKTTISLSEEKAKNSSKKPVEEKSSVANKKKQDPKDTSKSSLLIPRISITPKVAVKKSKGVASSQKSTAKDSDEDAEDEAEPEYTPRKSKSRGGDFSKSSEPEKKKGKSSRSRK